MTTNEKNQIVTAGAERRPLIAHVAGRGASVLRAVAGVPAGVARTRRGTFLVVVIGTLALLAVIAIAHFTIGQADRRTASAVQRATEIDDVPQQFADYVANLIGRDALGVVPEPVNETMTPGSAEYNRRYTGRREAQDRPYTSWMALSTEAISTLANGQVPNRAYFTPEGVDSDPWLADIAPRWLNWTGQDTPTADEEYLYRRDWGKISNIAPDGRFVSLMNLRGNFGAESGFGNAANGRPRMSSNLTLLQARDPNDPLTQYDLRAGNARRTDFGLPVPQSTFEARPAVWDSRQVGAFRPAKARQAGLLPSQPGYLDNEWVDTDGDGFVDARWQELVDARNLATVQSYLQTDGRMRWFFATRIIDLSGLVNVNTATDFRYQPNSAFPMGMTPADVDLKRLLTMQDSYDQWTFGYDALMQPVQNPNNYPAPAPGPMGSNNYLGYNRATAFQIGTGAYDALRWSIKSHMVPPRYQAPTWDWEGAGISQPTTRGVVKHQMWLEGGRSLQGASVTSGGVLLPSFFPPADTGELLTRFHVNDPRETSRLEAATGARLAAGGGPAAVRPTAFDPLRQNREEVYELDRTRAVQGTATPARMLDTGDVTLQAMAHMAVDVRGQVTTLSASRPIKSVVGNETTAGASLPLGTQLLAERDGKLELGKAAITDNGLTGDEPAGLFRAYVRSLAPGIKLPGVWRPSGGNLNDFDQRKTLFYGHQGPELALLVAGSMTVNFEELVRDTEGTTAIAPRTLVFDGEFAERLYDNQSSTPPNANGLPAAPWLYADRTMSLEPDGAGTPRVLADGTNSFVQSPVLHLYGMGAQPFITEVGCYTVWQDTTISDGGDNDAGGNVTIKGDLDESNNDFVFRCVAVQLHNPFDERVLVSTAFPNVGAAPNTAPTYSYIRVTHAAQTGTPTSTIGLFSVDLASDQVGGLSLDAGETVVVCVFDRSPLALYQHLEDRGVVNDGPDARAFLRSWMNSQFDRNNVSRAVMGLTMTEDMSSWNNTFSTIIDDPDASRGTVFQMFQSQRANMEDYGGPNEVLNGAPNLAGNDRMLDRFRIPVGETIDARIRTDVEAVSGAPASAEIPDEDPAGLNFNSGIVVSRWATASRPSDPAGSTLPRGGLPAYCIEPQKPQAKWHEYKVDRLGDADSPVTISAGDAGSGPECALDLSSWKSAGTSNAYSNTMCQAPKDKSGSVPNIQRNRDSRDFALLRDLMPKAAKGNKGFGTVDNVFESTLPGDTVGTPTLRAADLLLPMAISPWESPLRPDRQPQTDADIRYLSTAEAFAVAYGYEEIPPLTTSVTTATPLSLYGKAANAQNSDSAGTYGDQDRPVIQSGHIVIDDFVPFYDGNRDGVFSRDTAYNGVFQNQGATAQQDIRMGLGIPAALGILDQVSTMAPIYGSVMQPIAGQININTAPPNVLRMLPMLTPGKSSWGANLVWNNANANWTQMQDDVDLAASVLAYRDKSRAFELPGRTAPAGFYDDGTVGTPIGFITNQQPRVAQSTERQVGRALKTQLNGIREEAGFLSVGELQCVLNRNADDRGQGATRNRKQNIDRLGYNDFNRSGAADNDKAGFNSLLFKDGATIDVDQVHNDFAERLQVLNALGNVTTVRSDMYACWFVVRGYAQGDVDNLGPDEQMTPSVERRFLMILDRSNVVESRQTKPRIVMIKEVPM